MRNYAVRGSLLYVQRTAKISFVGVRAQKGPEVSPAKFPHSTLYRQQRVLISKDQTLHYTVCPRPHEKRRLIYRYPGMGATFHDSSAVSEAPGRRKGRKAKRTPRPIMVPYTQMKGMVEFI